MSNSNHFDDDLSVWASKAPLPDVVGAQVGTGEDALPLVGLRLGVKDLFHIAGLPTAAGNPDWLASHAIPTETNQAVKALLKASAVFCGKTQTDELAYSLNGLNYHYGAPINPAAPERLPGGSSSGSAVATAAGEIDIGLGTDTGGSIRVPASYNGLFGIRTTHGAIACDNMVPLAPSFDTVGWLTRDAATLARVGDILLPAADSNAIAFAALRVAIIVPEINGERLWQAEHETWFAQHFSHSDCTRIALSDTWLSRASLAFRQLQGRDIWKTHGAWVTKYQPKFSQDVADRFTWASTLTEADEQEALEKKAAIVSDVNQWFDDFDVILLPTTPGPSPLLSASAQWKDHYRSQLMGLTAIAGLNGLPQVHLPVLQRANAPMGISLLAAPGRDRFLLSLAQYLV